ncbi:MAG: hypothetical protein ACOYD4_15045 [Solirubrobacterales bacterium]
MNLVLLILVVIVTLQVVAFAVAIVARYWVLRSETFELHGIDVARATELVSYYVQGVHDHRFGFPTGVFAVEQDRTSPGRVVAREINIKGSAGIAPIKLGLTLPFIGAAAGAAMGADADDASAGCMVSMVGGMMGFALGAAAAAVLVVPFAFLTVVEMILRVLMRGQISATIDKIPDEDDAVRVRFEMRGLSAFGIEHQLRRGMEPPKPEGVPAPSPEPVAPGQPAASRFDRLNAIYLSAASVGLALSIVAFIVIGNVQTSSTSAASSSSYEEEPYYEEYEEEPYYEEEEYGEEGRYEEEEGGGYEEEYEEAEEAPALTRYDAASQMFRRYWTAIDEGDYGAAYSVYYRTFATQEGVSRGEFVAAEYEYLPEIGLERMSISSSSRNPSTPNELWLYVEVPIRDGTGEFEGQCRVFYGDVRMFHADGRWYYRPGVAFGRKPSFGQEGGGIRTLPSYSERCSQ